MTTEPVYDYEKARNWRERRRLSRPQLSALTGYSLSSINDFELGFVRGDRARPISASAMRRYRMVLAAISHGLEAWDFTDER